jgi:hypothetical protein
MASGLFISAPTFAAAVTNMSVIGGCPSGEDGPECYDSGQATVTNVSILVGQDVIEVAQGEVTSEDPWVFDNPAAFTITNDGSGKSGTWTIFDSAITHLAFKADGYYILGEVALGETTGIWSTVITDWSPDITTLTCPAGICDPADRKYTEADFQNKNGEPGNYADLSNVRAFSAVPVPTAVWLFGSALAGLGFVRRKRMSA